MKDDNSIFEEEEFDWELDEDEEADNILEEDTDIDEEVEHMMEIMQYGLDICSEIHEHIQKINDLNTILVDSGLLEGIYNPQYMELLDAYYNNFIPDLILDENRDELLEVISKTYGTTEKGSSVILDESRDKLLNKLEESKNNK